ncbi:MAG TPA: hypothetical protein VFF64_14820 [Candidatus Eremiobacteraceae bacterium]|nr:hypothetical protein [Candidatus Eremiobacteraceae bacterium]
METTPKRSSGESSDGLRQSLGDAIRFWEPRRLAYNAILVVVTLFWVLVSWPHFRPALTLSSLFLLAILALLANLCYCTAYFVDIPIQRSALGAVWRNRRWILWSLGTLFAMVLASYWINDEIYPFVH